MSGQTEKWEWYEYLLVWIVVGSSTAVAAAAPALATGSLCLMLLGISPPCKCHEHRGDKPTAHLASP